MSAAIFTQSRSVSVYSVLCLQQRASEYKMCLPFVSAIFRALNFEHSSIIKLLQKPHTPHYRAVLLKYDNSGLNLPVQ